MEQKRPGTLTTIAVLNIVFGSLGLICACLNGFSIALLLSASPGDANPAMRILGEISAMLQREIPGYLAIEISRSVYFLVFSSLLIVAGIGLLYISNWARIISFIYAITSILTQSAYLMFVLVYVHPALARIQAQVGGDPFESKISQIAGLGGIGLIIIYGIVLIILLLLPSVSAAFAGQGAAQDYQRDEEDYDRRPSSDDY